MSPERALLDFRHAPRWPALLGSLLCAGALAGCTECQFPPPIQKPPAIVLTFDDGPLPGDLARPPDEYSADELLQPLRAILNTLERNNATAVFFIQGPGEETLDAEGETAFATALREMYDGGQTLGYHAYHADPAIWIRPCLFPPLAALPMSADLDRLVGFLNAVALPAGLEPDALFTPVFRRSAAQASAACRPSWRPRRAAGPIADFASIVRIGRKTPIVFRFWLSRSPRSVKRSMSSTLSSGCRTGCGTLRTSYSVNPVSLPS
jgi:hypothetical protein